VDQLNARQLPFVAFSNVPKAAIVVERGGADRNVAWMRLRRNRSTISACVTHSCVITNYSLRAECGEDLAF
jgi:hypothetical protein